MFYDEIKTVVGQNEGRLNNNSTINKSYIWDNLSILKYCRKNENKEKS